MNQEIESRKPKPNTFSRAQSNCVQSQALLAYSGSHVVPVLAIELSTVNDFLMHALSSTFLILLLASNR